MAMKDKTSASTHTFGLSQRGIKWLLFLVMSLTLPSLYFVVVAIAFVPLIVIVRSIFSELWLFGGIHSIIIGSIYFLIARLASNMIHYVQSERIRAGLLICIIAVLIVPAFFPIYVSGGHGSAKWYSWTGSFEVIK